MAPNSEDTRTILTIIIGLSGAGRSVAIKALEDLGFSCIDLLPLDLLLPTCEYLAKDQTKNYCIGLDIKDEGFVDKLEEYKKILSNNFRVDVVNLISDENTLLTRYSETRRKHPLLDSCGDLLSAIRVQTKMFSSVSSVSDITLDTSGWTPHYLERIMEERYVAFGLQRHMYVSITSFGFKHGLLTPVDNVYDVRFLANPYFVSELKSKNGLDSAVKDYIRQDKRYDEFMKLLESMYKLLLPSYYEEGKHFLRIGIGCTGGRHRSVCVAEHLSEIISSISDCKVLVSVHHRDLGFN